jgi:hypothetical protein
MGDVRQASGPHPEYATIVAAAPPSEKNLRHCVNSSAVSVRCVAWQVLAEPHGCATAVTLFNSSQQEDKRQAREVKQQ